MLQQLKTEGGINIEFEQQALAYENAIEPLVEQLDSQRGALFTSSFEYPGRYTCWDIGFFNPPLAITVRQQQIHLQALNQRGEVLLAIAYDALRQSDLLTLSEQTEQAFVVEVLSSDQIFSEEERSQRPSVFSVIRELLAYFKCPEEPYLGLYGALGYDLIFQFEALKQSRARDPAQRDMVLYLPDEIVVVNHRKEEAFIRRYDFHYHGRATHSLPRDGAFSPYQAINKPDKKGDHEPGEYAALVKKAKEKFACGDLFEVVPSQVFYAHCQENPSALFRRMRDVNPSPYGFLINLGEEEYLVGASPEMYVRVQGREVETCPISGTIRRGADAIEDAKNIQLLLDSEKEASELTMCTDVDRNDKSRICEPGSVQVIGRRQIEMYSRLIHTVDHVRGRLRDGFDAVDAFLTHMWVVTVTGAPKIWAMNFIEENEKSPRRWYAGAVGWFGFNQNLNTGLVLRTTRIKQGIAEVRTGATLLYDSDPQAEEQETRLKASAFIDILNNQSPKPPFYYNMAQTGTGKRVLLVDHQDSFVHTLANYIRQTGAEVVTVRSDFAIDYLQHGDFDLVVLSPGPGRPSDFKLAQTIESVLARGIALFGVCLVLQGIVEYFGGTLDMLDYPMHGKASEIQLKDQDGLFAGFSNSLTAGRYHSLYARLETLPKVLRVTAMTDDGIVMAIAHKTMPVYAVQFHPETILTMPDQAGFRIIANLMTMVGEHAH